MDMEVIRDRYSGPWIHWFGEQANWRNEHRSCVLRVRYVCGVGLYMICGRRRHKKEWFNIQKEIIRIIVGIKEEPLV